MTARSPDRKEQARLLTTLADVQFNGLQDYRAAAPTYQRLLACLDKSAHRDAALLRHAECWCKLSAWDDALRAYNSAVVGCSEPTTMLAARVSRADVFANLRRFQEALDAFAEVVRIYAGSTEAAYSQYRTARILDSDLKRYADAFAAYKAVIERYGSSQWVGECSLRSGWIEGKYLQKQR